MPKRSPPVEVRESDIQGRGVYAARAISKGTWIIEYTGERISHAEADMRYDDENMKRHHTFLFTIDEHVCIDAFIGGNEARYVNHSCEPNCRIAFISVRGEWRVFVVALRALAAGEFMSFDYKPVNGRMAECCCGAASCRRVML